jgi:hypothetical protein
MKTLHPKPHTLNSGGFTLVELIISVSIITLFGMLLLIKHDQFGESIALNNLAYETGLALREAQVFGISVREQTGGEFAYAYGVHFDYSSPDRFVSFIDSHPVLTESSSPDGRYIAGQDELLNTYMIGRGNYIEDICVLNGGTESCEKTVDVTFLRPEPDANFFIEGGGSADTVLIKLRTPKGLTKQVSVNTTGQISVE